MPLEPGQALRRGGHALFRHQVKPAIRDGHILLARLLRGVAHRLSAGVPLGQIIANDFGIGLLASRGQMHTVLLQKFRLVVGLAGLRHIDEIGVFVCCYLSDNLAVSIQQLLTALIRGKELLRMPLLVDFLVYIAGG